MGKKRESLQMSSQQHPSPAPAADASGGSRAPPETRPRAASGRAWQRTGNVAPGRRRERGTGHPGVRGPEPSMQGFPALSISMLFCKRVTGQGG